MTKRILLLSTIFLFLNLTAQVDWSHQFEGNKDDVFNTIVPAIDGGYILLGTTASDEEAFADNKGGEDVWIVKTDEFGQQEWSKIYGSKGNDDAITVLPLNNSYVIAGNAAKSDGDVTNTVLGDDDVWLFEIDLEGNMMNQKNYGGSAKDGAVSIQATQDGGYIVGGTTASDDYIIPNNNGASDFWLLKVDNALNLVWSKTYGGEGNDVALDMIALNDGGFLMVGSKWQNSSKDFYLLKIDQYGLVVWEKTYGGSGLDEANAVIETPTGAFLVVGKTNSDDGDVSVAFGTQDVWLIKVDATGNLLWEKTYGDENINNGYALKAINENQYLIGGEQLYKIDETGNLLWDTDGLGFIINDFLVEDNDMVSVGTNLITPTNLNGIVARSSGNCKMGSQDAYLNTNNVNAYLSNGGSLFFDGEKGAYEVPKGSSKISLFAGALWMGGIDNQGTLRVTAPQYKDYEGSECVAGPILDETQQELCNHFDRFWEISKTDVEAFISVYAANDGVINQVDIPESILQYPARNNPYFSDFELPENKTLAPFIDANNDGNYNPLQGDYPAIKGDQNIWWVYNDQTVHTLSQGIPLNMEVGVMAYAVNTEDYLNNTTFYDFTLTYKGDYPLETFYAGFWIDPDLGNFTDDYIGCNVDQKMGIVYNGDAYDDGQTGYHDSIPALGVQFVTTPLDENGEEAELATFMLCNSDFTATGLPKEPQEYYNYLKGSWLDGTPVTYGGNGYGGIEPYPYMFPDNPTDPNGWSELALGFPPADRIFLLSIGPIKIQPNEVKTFTTAIHWQPLAGGGAEVDINPLYEMAENTKANYDELFPYVGADSTDTNLQNLFNSTITAYPNPINAKSTLHFEKAVNEPTQINVYSIEGKHIGTYKTSTNAFDLSNTNIAEGSYIFELINKSDTHIFKICITK